MNTLNTTNLTQAFASNAQRELANWHELLRQANSQNASDDEILAIEQQIDRLLKLLDSSSPEPIELTSQQKQMAKASAYPYISDRTGVLSMGLSKRELLAAMAMQALVANPARVDESDGYLAECAVSQSDAMIQALTL